MDNNMDNMGFGGWGFLVFIILIFWFGFGNNGFGRNSYDNGDHSHYCNCVSNCDIEKQGLKNTMETNYRIERANADSTAAVIAGQHSLQERMDYYELTRVRDELNETKRQLMAAEDRNYNDNKFNAIEAQLASIQCNQMKAPQFIPCGGYVQATCGNYPVGGGGCGCGGNGWGY